MTFARWLLERFGVAESLVGDIEEERSAGQSAGWLARQTCIAIGQTAWRDLRSHPLLPFRAIFVGWVGFLVWSTIFYSLITRLHLQWPAFLVIYTIFFHGPFLSGLLVALTHRKHVVARLSWCLLVSLAIWSEVLSPPEAPPNKIDYWNTPLTRAIAVTLGVLWGTLLVRPPARRPPDVARPA